MLVVAYAIDPDLAGLKGQQLPPALLFGSIFPAVWSFQLAMRSRGLGTTPIFVADQDRLAEIVGAPEDAHLAAVLPVAYYTGTTFKPASRRPVEDVTFWNHWGTPPPGLERLGERGALAQDHLHRPLAPARHRQEDLGDQLVPR